MQFEYVLQRRDDAEARAARFPGDPAPAKAAAKRPALAHWIAAVVLFTGVVLLLQLGPAVAAAAAGYCPRVVAESHGNPNLFAAGTLSAAIGLHGCVIPVLCLLRARRSTRPVSPIPVTASLADDGVTLTTAAKEFTLAWAGVVAVAETPNLFVLKAPGDFRLPLPKRALPSADAAARLRELLHSHVPPLANALPTIPGATP